MKKTVIAVVGWTFAMSLCGCASVPQTARDLSIVAAEVAAGPRTAKIVTTAWKMSDPPLDAWMTFPEGFVRRKDVQSVWQETAGCTITLTDGRTFRSSASPNLAFRQVKNGVEDERFDQW